ncbi:MAG: phosphoenolpyruvate--protein phosphotransferase, partial [Mariprofundaceae bacterium]
LTGSNGLQTGEHGEGVVLVSDEFSPSQAVQIWEQKVSGFISEQGGANSHTIIVARGVGLPALVGATQIMDAARDGDILIIDGNQGRWFINPSANILARYKRVAEQSAGLQQGLRTYANKPSLTANGHHLPLMVNMEFIEELPLALDVGAEGMGLYRTEFLYLNRDDLPDEEEQLEHYRQIVQGMQGQMVTLRTLDIGGDKETVFQRIVGQRWGGDNPAMGLRGIRLMLCCESILRTQLRALLRAAEEGPVSILLPMVSQVSEVVRVRELLEQCQKEIGSHNKVPLGSMIEVPAAALIADQLANVCDFFSVGTNDLIQYTLAVDRGDEKIAELNNPGHDAVLTLLRFSVNAAKKADIPISMCGEMAGDSAWTETLLNMGFNALSMSASRILEVRKHLSGLHYRPDADRQNVTHPH